MNSSGSSNNTPLFTGQSENMALEIERKFLVKDGSWREHCSGSRYSQGYAYFKDGVLRVRIVGDSGYLTLKSRNTGLKRFEYEYPIPITDANDILRNICEKPTIEKTRYRLDHNGMLWEVDEFHGDNDGLILAEVELEEERQELDLPPWIGKEVTGDARFYNSNLTRHPYSRWAR